jgi:hypothetical protein
MRCRALSGVYIDILPSLTKLRFAEHPKAAMGAGRLTAGLISPRQKKEL